MYNPENHQPKDLDYIMAVNLLTAFILIKIGKMRQALDFIEIAEEMLGLLVKYNVENMNPPQLQRYLDKLEEYERIIYEESKPYMIDVTDFQTG